MVRHGGKRFRSRFGNLCFAGPPSLLKLCNRKRLRQNAGLCLGLKPPTIRRARRSRPVGSRMDSLYNQMVHAR